MRTIRRFQRALTFGDRIHWGVGLAITLVVVSSIVSAISLRHGPKLFPVLALDPEKVWNGELWRLFTWPFPQTNPYSLIFTIVALIWFGRDLAAEWGSRWFLRIFAGVIAIASVITCVVARFDADVFRESYVGGYALTEAIFIAWGLTFPDRIVRIYFVIPIRGFWLAWLTVAISIAVALYAGWAPFLPWLAAEAAILGYLYRLNLRRFLRSLVPARPRPARPAVVRGNLRLVRDRRDLN
jgi:membrane associated rhomboid family serine protease